MTFQCRRGPAPDVTFCIYGVMTANFWHCFDADLQTSSTVIVRCLQRMTQGPLLNMDTRESWGPLEFSQSSNWPLHLLDVRLVQDQWTRCSDQAASVSSCAGAALSVPKLRLLHGLLHTDVSTPASELVLRQLDVLQRDDVEPLRGVKNQHFRMMVIGSHMGSNMEPLSMVESCFANAGLSLHATVLGTIYPFPEIMCESFGHCASNRHIDDAVRLLVQQMYRPSWEPQQLLNLLSAGLEDLGQTDLILCAQPMVLCSFLRSLVDQPMLLYQAFPLVGATPKRFRHLLLVQLREVQVSNLRRSTLIAYSEFLAQQVQRQTGQRPQCIRPHSLYALGGKGGAGASTYHPDTVNPRVLLGRLAGWARDGAGAMVQLMEAFAGEMLRPSTSIRLVP